MARTVRRVRVVGNLPRRRRRNAARKRRHNLSPKQIKFFGTPAQKAALKRSRATKRSNGGMRRKRHSRRNLGLMKWSERGGHGRWVRAKPRPKKKNIGEILSLTLGNPPRKARKAKARKTKGATAMAATKRRRRRAPNSGGTRRRRRKANTARRHHATTHRRRRTYRMNAGTGRRRRRYTRHNRRRVNRRRNAPSMGGIGAEIMDTLWLIGGAVGTGMLTQAVMGSANASWAGYAGNLVAGFGLSFAIGKLLKMPNAAKAVFKGSILQVVLRIIRDQTPFGQYTSNLGMGDYLASNWVTPQRYVDPMNSAQVQIPSGWGQPAVVAAKSSKGGVSGVTDFGALYSAGGSGLYN